MPERHHYVPKVLLRGFSEDDKIWIFDKTTKKSFQTNIINAFVERDFNSVLGEGFTLEAEDIFTRAEDAVAPILQNVRQKRDIRHLDMNERVMIATFVTLQYLRSKQSRRFFSIFREEIQRRFPGISQSQFDLPGLKPNEGDKLASLDFIVKNLGNLTQHVVDKDFLLVELESGNSFWLSDHPVILHNDRPIPNRGNIGFAVSGIQLYLPISPKCAVAFFCPSIRQELKDGLTKVRDIKTALLAGRRIVNSKGEPTSLATIEKIEFNLSSHFEQMHTAQKLRFNADNMTFLNSAQVCSAHRFLAAPEDNFALAIEMLNQSPELENPQLFQFG